MHGATCRGHKHVLIQGVNNANYGILYLVWSISCHSLYLSVSYLLSRFVCSALSVCDNKHPPLSLSLSLCKCWLLFFLVNIQFLISVYVVSILSSLIHTNPSNLFAHYIITYLIIYINK